MFFSLVGTAAGWAERVLEGMLRAWTIFWQSDASTAFMAGACLILVVMFVVQLAERKSQVVTLNHLVESGILVVRAELDRSLPVNGETRVQEAFPASEESANEGGEGRSAGPEERDTREPEQG